MMIADLKPYPAMKDSGVEWLRAALDAGAVVRAIWKPAPG